MLTPLRLFVTLHLLLGGKFYLMCEPTGDIRKPTAACPSLTSFSPLLHFSTSVPHAEFVVRFGAQKISEVFKVKPQGSIESLEGSSDTLKGKVL